MKMWLSTCRRLFVCFGCCFFLLNIYGQQLSQNLESLTNKYPAERVYLHYDKSSYAPGETVWLKAYMLQGIFPATDSKTLYIDWTDDNGKLLLHALTPLVEGTAVSQFKVPVDYAAKFVHVKAYTKWMLNFDSAFLYNNDLRVISQNHAAAPKVAKTPGIQFFPEGGDIISGINNKVAFKANDQFGMPVKVSGNIIDQAGKEVAIIKEIHDGMGFFMLRPAATGKFTARWKDENGKSFTTVLPAVKANGVGIEVTPSPTNQVFVLTSSNANDEREMHIVGNMYQHPVFNTTKKLVNGTVKGVVPTTELPSGILTISVFDDAWQLISERISFINNHEFEFIPEMTVQHWGLNKRARNEVEIAVPADVTSTLSVSVTDIDIESDSSESIISHLLLTGELRGKVFNPAWYFYGGEEDRMQELDLVLLTNGWRRIAWEKVKNSTLPQIDYARDTSYLSISGKVYGATAMQLRDAGNIILLVNSGEQGRDMLTAKLLPDGSFRDPGFILFDTANVYYQLPAGKGLDGASVKFLEDRLPSFKNNTQAQGLFASNYFDTAGNARHLALAKELTALNSLYAGKVLETVSITAKTASPIQILEKKYTSGLFSGGDGYQFDLIHDTRALGSLSIFNYLQGQVAGLQISTIGDPPTLSWRGSQPQLYVNEVQSDASMVASIPVTDVAYIKVLRPPFMGGAGGGSGGAIAIYTKKGDDVKPEPGKGLSNNNVTGYTPIRQFYSPNYGTFTAEDEKKDIRTTLYWNPGLRTVPGQEKTLFTFYNNDVTKAFRVIVEGMTKDGKLAHLEQTME